MCDGGICIGHTNVPGGMRKESGATTATTTTFANRPYGFAIGESEHHQSGRRDDVDLADHQRHRREH